MSLDMTKTEETAPSASSFSVAYAVPRVNLLPDEILAERRLRRTQMVLGAVTLAVVGALAGGYVVSAAAVQTAETALADEQARTDDLNAQAAEFADVPLVLGQVQQAQDARSAAMAQDVLWFSELNQLANSYPANVWLRDMTVTLTTTTGTVTAAPDPAAATTPTGLGTLMFNGTGLAHSDASAFLDVLESTPGYSYPYLTVSERVELDGSVVVDFTATVNVTDAVLSHRFEPKAS